MSSGTRTRTWSGAAAAIGALALAACGSQTDYANNLRPPTTLSVDASVTGKQVSISPTRIGSGPIDLTIANLSSRSLDIKLDSPDSPEAGASSGPINPGGTAHITVDVKMGTYHVSAGAPGVRPATLQVGGRRPSAQNDLQLP